MSDLSRFQHPRFARLYEKASVESEQRGTGAHRKRALGGVAGRVIEVGAGNGLNFAHYPADVTELVAIEPDDHLRALAERSAGSAPIPVTVLAGHADELPGDGYDAAVTSLVLCSVPSQRRTLAELRRVLRPGGELRFYEHVRSRHAPLALLEDLLTPLWRRISGGCHPNRDTTAEISAAGFEIIELDRFPYRPLRYAPKQDHILGRARRP